MRKIFEIGHGKTGSTSLFHAVKRLGYTACHWPIPGSRNWLPKLLLGEDFRFDFLDEHEFSGNGLERFYRHLDRLYPDAKFILTVRDESDWLRSYERHLQGTRDLHQPVHFYAYMLSSYGAGNFDSDLWLRAYRNHHSEVRRAVILIHDFRPRKRYWPILDRRRIVGSVESGRSVVALKVV